MKTVTLDTEEKLAAHVLRYGGQWKIGDTAIVHDEKRSQEETSGEAVDPNRKMFANVSPDCEVDMMLHLQDELYEKIRKQKKKIRTLNRVIERLTR